MNNLQQHTIPAIGVLQSTPGRSDLEAQRLALATHEAEAEEHGLPWLAAAFYRLALMHEVGECLVDSSPEAAAEVAGFNALAYDRLTSVADEHEREQAAAWVGSESSARWGEYLALLDPSWSETEGAWPAAEDPDTGLDDGPGAIDASTLLRMLTGIAPAHEGDASAGSVSLPPIPDSGCHGLPATRAPRADNHTGTEDGTRSTRRGISAAPAVERIDPALRDVFLAEAADLFERVEAIVNSLVEGPDQAPGLHEMGRCLHTLKGAAGSVGLAELAALIHGNEEQLQAASGVVTGDLIDRLHVLLHELEGAFDALRGGAASVEAELGDAPRPSPEATPAQSAPESSGDATAGEGPVRVAGERVDELMDIASELISRRGLWAAQAESMKELASLARTGRARMTATIDQLRDLYAARPASPGCGSEADEVIRRLVEQADDLVVILESAQAAARPLAESSDALARQSLQLWEALQSIRIVPVRGLFQRLTRVAHEAARVEGRQVEVVTLGEETGLDRAVQDKAFEPLLHVVRNAVCHGIEPAEERTRLGKPPAGRVTLEATRSGNTLVLSVEDDGRGLDYEAIAAKGRRLGLIGPDDHPGDDRLGALIFQPGFSTREAANSVAGRGVGMDVVSREVGRLHGTVALASQRGRGTRLSLSLPARLALEKAMVLRIGGQAFALPVALVERAQPLEPGDVDQDGPCPRLRLRDAVVPLVVAREALGFPASAAVSCPKVLLVRADARPLAVLVDAIDGTRELVIRPLGPLLAGHPLISGTSLSATGEVIYSLKPDGLARWLREGTRAGARAVDLAEAPRAAPILVVDDSISVRRAVVRHLRMLGLEVEEVSDGLEALGKLRKQTYGLVISDLEMPRMDGFELLAELSRLAIAPGVPVLVASARSDPETRRRAMDLGAVEFLAKPIDTDLLADRVQLLLRSSARPGPGPEPGRNRG